MSVTAGEIVTITYEDAVLIVRIEDASKSETISARVEEVQSGENYSTGQVYDFDRKKLTFNTAK